MRVRPHRCRSGPENFCGLPSSATQGARDTAVMGEKKSKKKELRKVESERLAALLDAVWEHRDELQRLAVELPALLAATGAHLQAAGLGARRASAGLEGDVRELAGHAADMLAASKDQLRSVLRALEGTGAVLRNVPFIGGELGATVTGGLGAISDVADHLEVAGDKVRTLGERLATVGADLDVMGGSLLESARAMGVFVGVDLPGPGEVGTAPSKKGGATASAKKPSGKKAPAKKAPAKKAPAKKAVATTSGTKQAGTKKAPGARG